MKAAILKLVKENITAFLTVCTAYSWYCAYNYQLGYCMFYDIPSEYIDLATSDVLKFASAIFISGMVLVFQVPSIAPVFSSKAKGSLGERLFSAVLAGAAFVYFGVYRTGDYPIEFYYLLGFTMVVAILYFVTEQGKIKNYLWNDWVVPIFCLAILLPLYCMLLGYGSATKKKDYDAMSNHKTIIMIKKYGDNVLFKNYVTKSGSFGDSLVVVKLGPTYPLNFVRVSLKIKK